MSKLVWVSRFTSLAVLIICMPIAVMGARELGKDLGLVQVPVPVVGTGSMYPSLYWEQSQGGPENSATAVIDETRTTPHMYIRFAGITLLGKQYLHRPVDYGDMVAFQNDATRQILGSEGKDTNNGFIKRVIGKGGDTIELRDGYVYRNGAMLDEPYLYRPRSTYGGTTLADCTVLKIPAGAYFVLGDNRKISDDSRFELGLIRDQDITYLLPYREQGRYRALYRDTAHDPALSGTATLDKAEFYRLVTNTRTALKQTALKTNSVLERSAERRATALLASKTPTLTWQTAIKNAGYDNVVLGEFVTYGHFTAAELVQNLLANPKTAKQIVSSEFQDLGVATVNKEVNGCPTEIVVGHLGGYVPASYDEATLASWRAARTNLETILPSWEAARGDASLDQTKLAELLSLLHRRLDRVNAIISIMEKRAWLSQSDQASITQDTADAAQIEVLAKALNQR